MRHGEQPPARVPHRGQPPAVLRDADEDILNRVLGVLAGAGPPQREPVDIPSRELVELVEGLETTVGKRGEGGSPTIFFDAITRRLLGRSSTEENGVGRSCHYLHAR